MSTYRFVIPVFLLLSAICANRQRANASCLGPLQESAAALHLVGETHYEWYAELYRARQIDRALGGEIVLFLEGSRARLREKLATQNIFFERSDTEKPISLLHALLIWATGDKVARLRNAPADMAPALASRLRTDGAFSLAQFEGMGGPSEHLELDWEHICQQASLKPNTDLFGSITSKTTYPEVFDLLVRSDLNLEDLGHRYFLFQLESEDSRARFDATRRHELERASLGEAMKRIALDYRDEQMATRIVERFDAVHAKKDLVVTVGADHLPGLSAQIRKLRPNLQVGIHDLGETLRSRINQMPVSGDIQNPSQLSPDLLAAIAPDMLLFAALAERLETQAPVYLYTEKTRSRLRVGLAARENTETNLLRSALSSREIAVLQHRIAQNTTIPAQFSLDAFPIGNGDRWLAFTEVPGN